MLHVTTLGTLAFACGDRVIGARELRTRSAAHVIAALITATGHRIAAEELAQRIFRTSDDDELPNESALAKSLHAIRVAFAALETAAAGLEPEHVIVQRGGVVTLRLPPDTTIDAHRFRDNARAALSGDDPDALLNVLKSWTGEYLAFAGDRAVALARLGYAQLRREVAWKFVEARPHDPQSHEVMRRLAHDYPDDQRIAEYVMRCALRAGDRVAAVATYTLHREACAAHGLPVDDDLRALGDYLERSTFGTGSIPASPNVVRGRDETLAAIEGALARSARRVIVLSAAPGAGLTTVLRQLVVRARARGTFAAYARCEDPRRPDIALHDVVRGLTRTLSMSVKLRDRLAPPDTVVQHGDVKAALASFAHTLAYVAPGGGPLTVAIDEADRLEPSLVEAIVAACAAHKTALVFGTHEDALASAAIAETRVIPAFDAPAIRAIVEERLGARIGATFAAFLATLWPGDIRVVLAAARHGLESGIASRHAGVLEMSPGADLLRCIPERVYAMVKRRADGLEGDAYAVAVALAVVQVDAAAHDVSLRDLVTMLGVDSGRVRAAVDELVRRRLLIEGRRMPLAAAAYFAQYCSAARRRDYRQLVSGLRATAASSGSATN